MEVRSLLFRWYVVTDVFVFRAESILLWADLFGSAGPWGRALLIGASTVVKTTPYAFSWLIQMVARSVLGK